ncbi:DUF423 domain-containing protein [Tahibacter amnicola]|uniref:DUF423 domain-containing protein n=2 Tax=Tahibacter amnicola TaxID=2976241 RepID=A0ABY6BLB0_9GAMM|nr:DUF423 domain-containing protein [Tahibacter amnicola]UXI70650.1 DUF423 domain-containing protein [Tahibacter amnicola]
MVAAFVGAVGVALGAFGAHALKNVFDTAQLATWQTAVSYLFWHVLAAMFAAQRMRGEAAPLAGWSARIFLAGIFLFSGSLFALASGAPRAVGMITPLGGVCFIVGWILLALDARRSVA